MAQMDGQSQETVETQESQVSTDPWAAAFAALDKETEKEAEGDPQGNEGSSVLDGELRTGAEDTDSKGDRESDAPASTEDGIGADVQSGIGGPDTSGGEDNPEDGLADTSDFGITQEDIDSYRESIIERASNAAIDVVAKAYIEKGARHTNGKLGATINDPDVCKRDEDGVPRFYNPETGREFTGDNPRRQAQEWVDDYNRELAANFNKTCEEYSKRLVEKEAPQLAVMEFAPTYEKLDPVRQSMLDSLLEDYEIRDESDNLIGYKIDLNQALSAINRQVRTIQAMHQSQQQTEQPHQSGAQPGASGPALDMKSSATNAGKEGKPEFKSLAEAMEWEQDQILAKMKGSK